MLDFSRQNLWNLLNKIHPHPYYNKSGECSPEWFKATIFHIWENKITLTPEEDEFLRHAWKKLNTIGYWGFDEI